MSSSNLDKKLNQSNWQPQVRVWINVIRVKGSQVFAGILATASVPVLLFWAANYFSEQHYYNELIEKYFTQMKQLLIDNKLVHLYEDENDIKKLCGNNLENTIKEIDDTLNGIDERKDNLPEEKYEKYLKLLDTKDDDHVKQPIWVQKFSQANQAQRIEFKNLFEHLKKKLKKLQKQKVEFTNLNNIALSTTANSLRLLGNDDSFLPWHLPLRFRVLGNNPNRRELLINFLRQSQLGFSNRDKDQKSIPPTQVFLSGIDLGAAALKSSGANLEEIDFSLAILEKANFTKAILRKADLSSTNLRHSFLMGANFAEANLQKAKLEGANLKGANLKGADLRGAELKYAKFDHATKLEGAIYSKETTFSDGFNPVKSKMVEKPLGNSPCSNCS